MYKEIYFNTNGINHCILNVCVSLLYDFKKNIYNEILSGSSPIRKIEHQIDFIPKTFMPN